MAGSFVTTQTKKEKKTSKIEEAKVRSFFLENSSTILSSVSSSMQVVF